MDARIHLRKNKKQNVHDEYTFIWYVKRSEKKTIKSDLLTMYASTYCKIYNHLQHNKNIFKII